MDPNIDEKELENFKKIIYNIPDDEIEVLYDAMDNWTFGVGQTSELQDINAYIYDPAAPNGKVRNDKLFDILKKHGLCDFDSTRQPGTGNFVVLNNFRWTGPLANSNSLPENGTSFGIAFGRDLKLPRNCTDIIAVMGTFVKVRKADEENEEKLDKDLASGDAWYSPSITRIPTTKGPFPTSYIPIEGEIPVKFDQETWDDNYDDESIALRKPYMVWVPPNSIEDVFKNSKARKKQEITPPLLGKITVVEGVPASLFAECSEVYRNRLIREAIYPETADHDGNDKIVYKIKKHMVKLGCYMSGRYGRNAWEWLKYVSDPLAGDAWFGGPAYQTIMADARIKGQSYVWYGPNWSRIQYGPKRLTEPTGLGYMAFQLGLDLYGLYDGVSEGNLGKTITHSIGVMKTMATEMLKLSVKRAVIDESLYGLGVKSTAELVPETALAVAVEGGMAGNVVVYSSFMPELFFLMGLLGYAYIEDKAKEEFLYNQAISNKWEPYIYSRSGGRIIIQGTFNREEGIKSSSGQLVTAPLQYPKSDGGSFPAEYFPFTQDPFRFFSGEPKNETEKQQLLLFQTRFGERIKSGVPVNLLLKPHPRVIIPIDVRGTTTTPASTPGNFDQIIRQILQKSPFSDAGFPIGSIPSLNVDSIEPASMAGNIFGAIGTIDFNPPKKTDPYTTQAETSGRTLVDSDISYGNPQISYDVMDSMLDTGLEAIPIRHRAHQWGASLYSCLSLATQMIVDNLSNIPPVDLNTYPSKETDLIGGDNMSKFIPDLAMIGGHTAPYSQGDFTSTPPSSTCFPEYINVLTPDGNKRISEINIGDTVISFNENTGEILPKIVTHKFIHDDADKSDVYRYKLSNGVNLDITENHSVFTENNTFKQIGQLNIGDKLVDVENNLISILSKEFLFNGIVYNIEVEDFHTYFAEGIKVHNALKDLGSTDDYFITGNTTEPGDPPRPQQVKKWHNSSPGKNYVQLPKIDGARGTTNQSEEPVKSTWSFCFPSFSKIFTPMGKIKISDIKIGETIFTYTSDGRLEESIVFHKIEHLLDPQDVYSYSFSDGSVLFITDEHQVLKSSGEFCDINHIQIGEFVRNIFNEDVKLLSKEYYDRVPVYSIFPEKNNTYIVDGIRVNSGVLVDIIDTK